MKTGWKFFFVIWLFFGLSVKAQNNDLKIADQYFKQAEYEKAAAYYKKVTKRKEVNFSQYYDSYVTCLKRLREYDDLENLLQKLQKDYPDDLLIQVDYVLNIKAKGDEKEYKKTLKVLQENNISAQSACIKLGNAFQKRSEYDLAIATFLESRNYLRTPELYALSLADLYKLTGNKAAMVDELLLLIIADRSELEYVENVLQTNLTTEAEYDVLLEKIYKKIGLAPEKTILNHLLVWYYLQQNDFKSAFIEAKALDKKEANLQATGLMELANLAVENKQYTVAIEIYEYVSNQYAEHSIYPKAQEQLIVTKELYLKSTYPVDTNQVKQLIADYELLLSKTKSRTQKITIQRNQALLVAQYLHDYPQAIQLLDEILKSPGIPRSILAEIKIDKGDIHILMNEPWESTLLYSQAEKLEEDTPIGHQAKLKNAKLSYYKGNFELAKEHLDILKMATTREISNDAIRLSLLIQDNLNLDTSTAALALYAQAELYEFQNDVDKAISLYDSLLVAFPNHSLNDEAYMKLAQLYRQRGEYQKSTAALTNLLLSWQDDILGDNAVFMLGEIFEVDLNDNEKAKEYYKQVLLDYPGSIFTVEARKRYRLLRGDKI